MGPSKTICQTELEIIIGQIKIIIMEILSTANVMEEVSLGIVMEACTKGYFKMTKKVAKARSITNKI